MARPPRRHAYHHGDLRRALLDAALALVEHEGLAALSMREVAKRAGVTHAAPYHHFADRGAVVAAIAAEGFTLLRDEMDAAAALAGPRVDARLRACGKGYVRFALGHPAHFRVMFRPELSRLAEPGEPGERTAYDVIAEAVAACQEAGLAPAADHDLLVTTAWSMVHGLASLALDGPLAALSDTRGSGPAARPIDELVERVPDLFGDMFVAGGPKAPARARRAPRARAPRTG